MSDFWRTQRTRRLLDVLRRNLDSAMDQLSVEIQEEEWELARLQALDIAFQLAKIRDASNGLADLE